MHTTHEVQEILDSREFQFDKVTTTCTQLTEGQEILNSRDF